MILTQPPASLWKKSLKVLHSFYGWLLQWSVVAHTVLQCCGALLLTAELHASCMLGPAAVCTLHTTRTCTGPGRTSPLQSTSHAQNISTNIHDLACVCRYEFFLEK